MRALALLVTVAAISAVIQASDRGSGEVSYKIDIISGVTSCPDFKNEHITSALDVVTDEDNAYWSGSLDVEQEIDEGMVMTIELYRQSDDLGEELVTEMTADICQAMKEDDEPWTPVIEAMGLDGCPIPVKQYPIENLTLSLGGAKDGMTREFCTDYRIVLKIETAPGTDGVPTTVTCFSFGVAVTEYKED